MGSLISTSHRDRVHGYVEKGREEAEEVVLGGEPGDPARGHRVARAIRSGMVGINMPLTAFPGIPFGGYKQSGFGPRAFDRHARPLSRDEGRALLHEPEAVQPVRPLRPVAATVTTS